MISVRVDLRLVTRAAATVVIAVLAGWLIGNLVGVPGARTELNTAHAIILGAVEGITEFLPVSSTGHLTIAERLMGLDGTAADTYAIAIQGGAIVAVLALYRQRVINLFNGLIGRDADGRRLLICLVSAFIPAAVLGVLFDDLIKEKLFGPWAVIAAWALGGVLLLIWRQHGQDGGALETLQPPHAVMIGVAQAVALWPGTSRSLVALVGGLAVGLSLAAAVEFSFLLGLITLAAATVYDLLQNGSELKAAYGVNTPLIGLLVAFVTALLAVRWMVTYLQKHPLSVFGWYRLAAAGFAAGLVVAGTL